MSVVLDPVTHTYSDGLVTYESVSRVIKAVLPTDYSGIPPDVLENARLRGIFVDEKFCEWLRTGYVRVKAGSVPQEWADRLTMLVKWWERQGLDLVGTQQTFQDDKNLIAGTADITVRYLANPDPVGGALDLKVVSELQPSYALQLGAYAEMEDLEVTGIIHVTKDRVRLVEYDTQQVRADWRQAVEWWKVRKRLLVKAA